MTVKQQAQLKEIRRLLAEAYDDYFARSDGYHKSSEMAIEVGYPDYWARRDYGPDEACSIGVYSYCLGPSRTHYFDSFDEALAAVREWHRDQLAADYSEGDWS